MKSWLTIIGLYRPPSIPTQQWTQELSSIHFEKLVSSQLEGFDNGLLLSNCLSACRKFHSCENSLLRLTKDWRRSRDKKELVVIVSLDLSGESA